MASWTTEDMPDQTGRTVVITGASSGLGLRAAEALASRGADVLMACRPGDKAEAARDRVAATATGTEPRLVPLDLADLSSVEACAAAVAGEIGWLDGLINNAGVMAVPQGCTAEGYELQFGTNHLGHFALTGRLLGLLLAAQAPRVVTVSSNMHRLGRMHWDDLDFDRRYHRWSAYNQSKLANLLFMQELDRRAGAAGTGLVSVAAHPGYSATHLQFTGPAQTSGHRRSRLRAAVMSLGNRLASQPAAAGALPVLYGATADDVAGGEYFGPDGLFEMRGHPTRARMARRAHDEESAARLWEISEERTGVAYPFPRAG